MTEKGQRIIKQLKEYCDEIMSKELIERIDAFRKWDDDGSLSCVDQYRILLRDCRAELAKQAERVKALEALLLRVEAKIRTAAGYTIDLQKQWDAVRFADELAAVLREGKE